MTLLLTGIHLPGQTSFKPKQLCLFMAGIFMENATECQTALHALAT